MLRLSLFLCFALPVYIQAQDTIKVMHYNVLNYGSDGSTCDDITEKNVNLKKIIKYANPDLLTVNEVVTDMQGGENIIAKSILDDVLNTDGITHFERAFDTGIGSQVNMLYYNSNKLSLYDQYYLDEDVNGNALTRWIDIYRLYYNNISTGQDTVFIDHIVAHLKAGNTTDDILDRTRETEAIMSYLDNYSSQNNRIISGDFNVKTSNEDAFQNLINPNNSTLDFHDPINQLGDWNNNANFTNIHTQSTHTSGPCFSTGGMDDRFDFILTSTDIMSGDDGLRYIPGTYKAIGQDGNLFNQAMPTTGTGTVNATISAALYNMSDHLPVYLELYADANTIGISNLDQPKTQFWVNNPVSDRLMLHQGGENGKFYVELIDLQGHVLSTKSWNTNIDNLLYINDINNIKSGIYILKISSSTGAQPRQVLKVVKQ